MQNQEGEDKDKEGKGPAQTLPNLYSNNPRKTLWRSAAGEEECVSEREQERKIGMRQQTHPFAFVCVCEYARPTCPCPWARPPLLLAVAEWVQREMNEASSAASASAAVSATAAASVASAYKRRTECVVEIS